MAGPGKTPLRHAMQQNDDRTPRLAAEVAAMAANVGLKLEAPIMASLAQQIAREPPETERDAKRQTLAMLRTIALGKVTRLGGAGVAKRYLTISAGDCLRCAILSSRGLCAWSTGG
jgi:hypothetical protein